ncbi:IS66 family transposase [Salmonella enterica subsp. enterica serovar Bredeney]|nr:IS66 family transposase [Salmonella enterica subsp. enterica serovar Bredeney]ECD3237370.1 IS66 family transposase [Salmonella enterica subsp. enterica serovar Bredeney]EDO5628531.1 IS66 family transposase [Salmonella enterica]HCM6292721.1 IS66 family transposase [Salmonella enterica subsp. enterica serovar 16:l,v:-]
MISLPAGSRIWLVAGITDMRNGFNGLASKVQNVLKDDPFSGHLFIFRGRRGDQIKVLWADSDGLCLFTKRLERGRFVWPVTRDGKVHLTPAQLSMLEGMETSLAHENARLWALLQTQQDTIRQMAEYNRLLSQRVAAYASEINRLKALVAKLQRMQFGKSSEKLRAKTERQIQEAQERISALQEEMAETLGEQYDPALPSALRQSSARKPLLASLPRETRVIRPEEECCPACGGDLSPLGCDVSEQLELISSAFKVIETQRPKLACCRCDVIVQAPVSSKPIARSYAGPGLLAHVVTGKYADHLPLYRQSEIYRRQGVDLSRATLGRWTGAVAELLEPVYDELRQYVLMPGKVHADDIPVPVQEPGSGKTRTARLWVYVRDDRNAGSEMPPAVWFAYSPGRKGIHPQNHLAGYSGVLQADAYGGYRALYGSGRITEAACMAHARRKIHDVHARAPTDITTEALQRIGELYVIEAEVRGCSAEQRLAARKARAAPLMQSLYDWIQQQMKTLSRHSDTAKAFAYLLKQWDALNVYCSNGWVEIDNNIAENALRGVAVGRKNWLFAGSDSGGEHAAVLYSLIGTCRLNNVEPEKWLRYVIEHIQDWPANRVRDLLPWKVDLTAQ